MKSHAKMLIATVAVLGLSACAGGGRDDMVSMSRPATAQTSMGQGTMGMAPTPAAARSDAVIVGGQPMLPNRTIVANAVNSQDHETLVAAVKAAGLVDTLQGSGPFTVFAPTDAAFAELPPGTVETLTRPENKQALTGILTYHVVPGRLDMAALKQQIMAGNGSATLKTASGGTLTAMMNGTSNIAIRDVKGQVANVSTYDVYQSNGVIHVVDGVLLPN